MNNPNTQIPNRKTIRLQNFDYSQAGLYFITICVKNMDCSFGNIRDKKMIPNNIGQIANDFWQEIPKHFSNVVMHGYIIMPNHVHGIIEIRNNATVRTRHVVSVQDPNGGDPEGASHVMPHYKIPRYNQFSKPVPGSVSVIIQQYKSSVKRWCNKNNYRDFQWLSRFYEHVIGSERSYRLISDYISDNPFKWKDDKFYRE